MGKIRIIAVFRFLSTVSLIGTPKNHIAEEFGSANHGSFVFPKTTS